MWNLHCTWIHLVLDKWHFIPFYRTLLHPRSRRYVYSSDVLWYEGQWRTRKMNSSSLKVDHLQVTSCEVPLALSPTIYTFNMHYPFCNFLSVLPCGRRFPTRKAAFKPNRQLNCWYIVLYFIFLLCTPRFLFQKLFISSTIVYHETNFTSSNTMLTVC